MVIVFDTNRGEDFDERQLRAKRRAQLKSESKKNPIAPQESIRLTSLIGRELVGSAATA